MKVAVSILKIYGSIKTTIEKINVSSADYLHIDLMDGKFIKEKSKYLPSELNKIMKYVKKPLDVHLMAMNPLKYLDYFASLNTEYFTFHYEVVKDIESTVASIKEVGLKPGLSINPRTKVKEIKPYLEYFDQILIMSVKPGMGGQEFIEKSLKKLEELNKIKNENNLDFIINIDGSINGETIGSVKNAGADMVVSGSYICNSEDYEERINNLK